MLIMVELHHQFVRIYPVLLCYHVQSNIFLLQNHMNPETIVIEHIPELLMPSVVQDEQIHLNNDSLP